MNSPPEVIKPLSPSVRRGLLALGLLALLTFAPAWGRPIFRLIESNQIDGKGRQRVLEAGGWEALEKVCLSLATNRSLHYPSYELANAKALPGALAALAPRHIRMSDYRGTQVMEVSLYGIHRTGSYDEPYYGIWVICSSNTPPVAFSQAQVWRHGMRGKFERKGAVVYEVR